LHAVVRWRPELSGPVGTTQDLVERRRHVKIKDEDLRDKPVELGRMEAGCAARPSVVLRPTDDRPEMLYERGEPITASGEVDGPSSKDSYLPELPDLF